MIRTPLVDEWLTALRSGRYEQGSSALRTEHDVELSEAYCCLGVLCDLDPNTEWDPSAYVDKWRAIRDGEGSATYLPLALRDELEISDANQHALTNLNDFESRSFEEIADYIEHVLLAS